MQKNEYQNNNNKKNLETTIDVSGFVIIPGTDKQVPQSTVIVEDV